MLFILFFLFATFRGHKHLFEIPGDVANGCPVFDTFTMLSAHFDEEASVHDFFISTIANKVDGIYFAFKNHLK